MLEKLCRGKAKRKVLITSLPWPTLVARWAIVAPGGLKSTSRPLDLLAHRMPLSGKFNGTNAITIVASCLILVLCWYGPSYS